MKRQDWFQDLFNTHYAKLCQIAYRYIPDKSSCEDIVQECFICFWEQQKDKKEVLNAPAYLSIAVKNKCISELRKQINEVSIEDNELQSSILQLKVLEETNKPDVEILIEEALGLLPKKCRIIFEKSRFEKKTYQQIADELYLSVKTIENQMGKSIKILKQYVCDHPEYFIWCCFLLTSYL